MKHRFRSQECFFESAIVRLSTFAAVPHLPRNCWQVKLWVPGQSDKPPSGIGKHEEARRACQEPDKLFLNSLLTSLRPRAYDAPNLHNHSI